MEIYLDNSATTRCFDEVAELVGETMRSNYGNPSSLHHRGVEAENALKEAGERLSATMKVSREELLFTSGGTESDNLALRGAAEALKRTGKHLITTQIEHPAVLQTCAYLETQGYEVTYLPVNAGGRISLAELKAALRPDTILVSIMHTNNEIGSVQPIEEAGALLKEHAPQAYFHVDAVQGYGKARIYPKRAHIDLMSVSAHKLHGPKGVGFLYVAENTKLRPILFGGGQQGNLRSGTENVPGIVGMARAAELLYRGLDEDVARLRALRRQLIEGVSAIAGAQVNGMPREKDGVPADTEEEAYFAPHIVSVSFRGVRSEVLQHALEDKGIYVSAGSACSSNRAKKGSDTLRAIHLDKALLESTLRFSLSVLTTEEEIRLTVEALKELAPRLARYTRQ